MQIFEGFLLGKKEADKGGSSPFSLRQPSHRIVYLPAYLSDSARVSLGLPGIRQFRSVGFVSPSFPGFTFIGSLANIAFKMLVGKEVTEVTPEVNTRCYPKVKKIL